MSHIFLHTRHKTHTHLPLVDELHFPFLSILAEFNTLSSSGEEKHPLRLDLTDTFTHLCVFNNESDINYIVAPSTTVRLQ